MCSSSYAQLNIDEFIAHEIREDDDAMFAGFILRMGDICIVC